MISCCGLYQHIILNTSFKGCIDFFFVNPKRYEYIYIPK